MGGTVGGGGHASHAFLAKGVGGRVLGGGGRRSEEITGVGEGEGEGGRAGHAVDVEGAVAVLEVVPELEVRVGGGQ
jgi:hypothetical protein